VRVESTVLPTPSAQKVLFSGGARGTQPLLQLPSFPRDLAPFGNIARWSFPRPEKTHQSPRVHLVSVDLPTYHSRVLFTGMASFEKILIKLVRAGLAGDPNAARRHSAALLRVNEPIAFDSHTRELLSELLLNRSDDASDDRNSRLTNAAAIPHPSAQEEGALALTRVESRVELAPPVLGASEKHELAAIISERERVAELSRLGLMPTRTLLLTGASGVGKTMTARFLAAVLGMPLVSIDLAAVVSSYLGRTGQNIRKAMDSARASPCVMLLDEIDALGKRRDDPADVGELKRIVNVLLLELEEWPATGLLVAATNHPELLDRAIWRRFDRVICLSLPDLAARQSIVSQVLQRHGQVATVELCEVVALATPGASGAVLTRLARDAVRQMILEGVETAAEILKARAFDWLMTEASRNPEVKREFAIVAHHHFGMSQRQIASVLGVSHVTVGTLLRATTGKGRDHEPRSNADPNRTLMGDLAISDRHRQR